MHYFMKVEVASRHLSTRWATHPYLKIPSQIRIYIIPQHTVLHYNLFCEGGGGIPISFNKADLAFPPQLTALCPSLQSWRCHPHLFQAGFGITIYTILYYAILYHKQIMVSFIYEVEAACQSHLRRLWLPDRTTLYYTLLHKSGGGIPYLSRKWGRHPITIYRTIFCCPFHWWRWLQHLFRGGGSGIPISL